MRAKSYLKNKYNEGFLYVLLLQWEILYILLELIVQIYK